MPLWSDEISRTKRRTCGFRMRQLPFVGILCVIMLIIVYKTTNYQHQQTKLDSKLQPFETVNGFVTRSELLSGLPQGIIHSKSDLELMPLWSDEISRTKSRDYNSRNLLAVPVGIDQKENVDLMVRKFISENFTIILFHYDGNISGWWDLGWSTLATHVSAQWQTKWWFAKRFLHPDIVSMYDYIFLWDEDLGVDNFNPRRYLDVMRSEGLEISQPALDPDSSEIHHRITIRKRTKKVHRMSDLLGSTLTLRKSIEKQICETWGRIGQRHAKLGRVYEARGSTKCFNTSLGPPCTGWVEGMAPVFSRSAWYCAWHLIQNDLVHGWGLDMKLGYCAQGDRTKKVGIIDSEYIVHHGIQTLGGTSKKMSNARGNGRGGGGVLPPDGPKKGNGGGPSVDARVEIRRQSVWELQTFRERWNRAVQNDQTWLDPYNHPST